MLLTGTSLAANALLNKKHPFDITAAYQGLQTDAFNRQLHPDQVALVKSKAAELDGEEDDSLRNGKAWIFHTLQRSTKRCVSFSYESADGRRQEGVFVQKWNTGSARGFGRYI